MRNIFIGILILTAVFGCKKWDQNTAVQQPEVVFSIVEVDPQENNKSTESWECPTDENGYLLESAIAEVVINDITYTPAVYRMNGKLYTKAIKLDALPNETKIYTVTRFVLKSADGTIVMADPEKSSAYSQYVGNAVPFTFEINGFSKVETGVDVVCFLPENYKLYGFDWFSIDETVIREKCFFGDICINPSDYVNSDYENQSTGLQVDMPAIVKIVVKKDGVEVENSPFTNASDEMGWGLGQPLCVQYPDDLNIEGEEFTFDLNILVADDQGNFVYQLFHTFTATDDGPLDVTDYNNDGIVDFVLGDCVYNDPDNPTIDLELNWNPNTVSCETAFAFLDGDATCFLDMDEIHTNRWGWTNGPFSENIKPYHLNIYAGAAKCDIEKGTFVGTLSLYYNNGDATITYTMNSGYLMDEVHLYAGNEILPRDKHGNFTVSPGQYPHVNDNLNGVETYTDTFTNLTGDIYIVAHAVVCGLYP